MKPQPCPACGNEPTIYDDGGSYGCQTEGCWLASTFCAVKMSKENWNRLRLAPAASDETIPVRIAVVVDGEDNYGASGLVGADDLDSRNDAAAIADDYLCGPTRTTFVTALAYKPQQTPAMEVTGDSQPQ